VTFFPKVSILMNCYNGESFLYEALDGIRKQTYTNWEVIFIDNNSIDRSAEIASSFGAKVKIFKTPKKMKLYEARHFGLEYCDGDYLAVADVDDIWLRDKLAIQLKIAHLGKDFIFTDFIDHYEVEPRLSLFYNLAARLRQLTKEQREYSVFEMLRNYNFNLQTVLLKRNLINDVNFDPEYDIIGDFDFFLRVALESGVCPYYIQDVTAVTRVHPAQLSNSSPSKWVQELAHLNTKLRERLSKIEIEALEELQKTYEFSYAIQNAQEVSLPDIFSLKLGSPSRFFLFSRLLYSKVCKWVLK
jgi:glycosyltransferase involved in cell wall biosynthesis